MSFTVITVNNVSIVNELHILRCRLLVPEQKTEWSSIRALNTGSNYMKTLKLNIRNYYVHRNTQVGTL